MEEELSELIKNIWDAEDKGDFWQTGLLLEKVITFENVDYVFKYQLAKWLVSIAPNRSIELFKELLIDKTVSFDDISWIHFHLGKLYMSQYDWNTAFEHLRKAYGNTDAKIAMGMLINCGFIGNPDTFSCVNYFDEAANRYHPSEKKLREICEYFLGERKKQKEKDELLKLQQQTISKLERQLGMAITKR